jgi:two-component system response regulator DesR
VTVAHTDYMVSQILPVIEGLKAHGLRCGFLVLSDPNKVGMLPPRRRGQDISFVIRDTPVMLVAGVVRRVAHGERFVDPRLQVAALATQKNVNTVEWQVLGLAAQGESVAEIARAMHLSLGTVRNYLSAVVTKTGARNRLDAIRIARKTGWLH